METTLAEAFKQTSYQLSGHSPRNLEVLKQALDQANGETISDMYGKGEIIEDFQNKMAGFLGKEAAVFFPSGTMAQQIALRIWADEKQVKRVAYHPLSHLEIHEEDGLKELHYIDTVLLADEDRVIGLDDIKAMDKDIACLLLELPQREIGGQLPTFETLEAISVYCRKQNIRLHLDGARLLETLPYYKKSASDICALFDSVYISMYKGLGGVAGAILAGETSFTEASKVWKRRHGGDIISLYPYILSADYYFEKRRGKMGQYYQDAVQLAAFFNQCPATMTIPEVPVSNMFHVHVAKRKEEIESLLAAIYQETELGLTSYLKETGDESCYFEVSVGDSFQTIPKPVLERTFKLFGKGINELTVHE
ncbi:low specificity L-threonine aldolase [Sediminibacillus dalangtanensis]|uniref:Low specificity L-threonine aldolase n=1 Tax=Sediminibacillus dalangtanensis TaxID=2729421 RepID=A0ABX7VR06_9BACI|nr:beta-eliminating lyase-related protein [Sediminibacillus dalangtanensis]QTM99076.1 low specificity L-threonine aldolase [Sediminibacillus dalangtanensis]